MIRLFITAFSVLLISACSVTPATDYRADSDFTQYSTFAFAPLPKGTIDSIDGSRIKDAVTLQLEQKGLHKAELENANLQVRYRVENETELQSSGGSGSYSYIHKRSMVRMSTPVNYTERKYGKLVLELLDPTNQSIIWKSISQNKLNETAKPQTRTEFINKEIALMLNAYPPAVK